MQAVANHVQIERSPRRLAELAAEHDRPAHPREDLLRARYRAGTQAALEEVGLGVHPWRSVLDDALAEEEQADLFAVGLPPAEFDVLSGDVQPDEDYDRAMGAAFPLADETSVCSYRLTHCRNSGKKRFVYEGVSGAGAALHNGHLVRGGGRRWQNHVDAIAKGTTSFFYNCCRKFPGRLYGYATWRVGVEDPNHMGLALPVAARVFAQYGCEGIRHLWMPTVKDRDQSALWGEDASTTAPRTRSRP